MTIGEIVVVFGLAGVGLSTVVYFFVGKVVMPYVKADKKKRQGRIFVRHRSLVCVADTCHDLLYELMERRKKEKMRATIIQSVEREFACFNPLCEACKEQTRIFGSYLKDLGPQHMRMRSEKPLRAVQ